MFTSFLKEENVLNQKTFLDYEVQFNLLHRILEGNELVSLKTEDSNAIALQNPGHAMWLWINENMEKSEIDNTISSLCERLIESKLHSISAKPEFAIIFAEKYSKNPRIQYELSLSMESYQCLQVIKPRNVLGKLIRARLEHVDIVADFQAGFILGCFGAIVSKESQIADSKFMIDSGTLFLWEVDNKICAMVNVAHRSARHARINDVYTMPEHRKNGYASFMVAELCSNLLEDGLIPMLYADTKNPDSNKVYKGIGFMESGRIDNYVFYYKAE